MNRTQNAIRNMSWGFLQKIITLLLPFITRTVLIKVLGAEYLGLSNLFTSILGLLSLAELGVSSAIISTMYKPIAENDKDTICALMAFYRKAYHIIGVVITMVGIGIMPFLDNLISGDIPADINVYALYLIYLANTAVSYFLFAYKNCLFLAHQRNDINSKVQTVCMILQNITQVILVLIFRNYYCFAIIVPICSILINVITSMLAKREYPEYVSKGALSKEVKADVKQKVMGLVLGKVSSTIRGGIDSLFISAFLGLKLVAMYSNYIYIVTSVAGIIQILETAIVAGVGNSIATDTKEKNYSDFLKFTFLLQWIVGWCAICILCLEQPFMKIWVGVEYMFDNTMAYLCALYLFTNCICLMRSIYTQALGMWWSLRYLSVLDICVNLFLNYFLGKDFGAYGILAATIIDISIVSIPWTTYFLFRDYFGLKKYVYYMFRYVMYFCVAVIVGCITYCLCNLLNISSDWLTLLVRGLICIVVPNLLYIFVFIRNKEFKKIASHISRNIA